MDKKQKVSGKVLDGVVGGTMKDFDYTTLDADKRYSFMQQKSPGEIPDMVPGKSMTPAEVEMAAKKLSPEEFASYTVVEALQGGAYGKEMEYI